MTVLAISWTVPTVPWLVPTQTVGTNSSDSMISKSILYGYTNSNILYDT